MEERMLESDVKLMPRPQRKRRRSIRGSAMMEFVLVMFPFMAITTFLVSIAWDYFEIANLQQAVREGCRIGITTTPCPAPTPTGGCAYNQVPTGSSLTALIKNTVKANALVSLPNPSTQIKVNYYNPPDPNWTPVAGSTPPPLTLTTYIAAQTGDLVVVSIPQYVLNPLVPFLFTGGMYKSDTAAWYVSPTSADLFESCTNCPVLGTWP